MLGVIAILSATSLAGQSDDDGSSDAAKVEFDFARKVEVGNHSFSLEHCTLEEVARQLGGRVENTGLPGDADPLWVVAFRDGARVVQFEADGDMGGPQHDLTGVTIAPALEDDRAAQLPALDLPITFSFGSIDMPLEKLEQSLGKATVRDGFIEYEFTGHSVLEKGSVKPQSANRPGDGAVIYDVSGWLRAAVLDGRVISIEISHITSS